MHWSIVLAAYRTNENRSIYAAGDEKGKLYRNRHAVILQRLQRHPLFMPPPVEFKPNETSVYYKVENSAQK